MRELERRDRGHRWQLLAGPQPDALKPIASVAATGFETAISASTHAPYLAVRALGGHDSAAIPGSLQGNFRRRDGLRLLVLGSIVAAAIAVYPVPGTVTATTQTQISFRGTDRPGAVVVTGSRSGPHAGSLRVHSDKEGASFIPNRPFTPGRDRDRALAREELFVHVGRRPPLPATRPAKLPGDGNGSVQRFKTRPDLVPPSVVVSVRQPSRTPGYIFIGPKGGHGQDGPMILDDLGRMIWFRPTPNREEAIDFRAQVYNGRPVLTWWQGRLSGGEGRGEGVIYSENYRALKRVKMANGLAADLHEFVITPQGTALLIAYDTVIRPEAKVTQAVVQEVEIDTGLVRFEWHSVGHIATTESYRPAPQHDGRWDYIHANSVAIDAENNFIVSARQTHAVYRISRQTGAVLWRLGGKQSDFKFGPGAPFGLQHDARVLPDGTITIFDNSANPPLRKHSRAIRLKLEGKRATLVSAFTHPEGLLSATQGGMQALPTGNTFVGWGSRRWFTEYDAAGNVVLDGRIAAGNDSYRAYRFDWTGMPDAKPKVVTKDKITYVSWNGATGVVNWEVDGKLIPSSGFETVIPKGKQLRALDANGQPKGAWPL